MADHKFRIDEDLLLKVKAEAKDTHQHKVGNSEFIHFHLEDKPSKASLQILLEAQKQILDDAWELFQKSENVSDMLDIVGSALYTVNLTYETNMKTLRQWHSNMWSGNDITDTEVEKKLADINAVMTEALGRPVDINGMSDKEMDQLIDEALAKGLVKDMSDLNNRLWGTGE